MSIFYEIRAYPNAAVEVESEAAKNEMVRLYIETGSKHVCVVTWKRAYDKYDHDRSCGMDIYENGVKRGIDISGG